MQFESFLQVVACLVTVLAFRAAAVVPGLAGWQAAAAGATWLVLGGRGSTLAGVLLLVLVLARAPFLRANAVNRDEVFFATLIGIVVAVGAVWNGRAAAFGWAAWLLPVAPLLIDVAFSAALRLYDPAGSSVRVSELIAQASDHPRVAGIVLFFLGLLWYGVAAWWCRVVDYSVLMTAIVTSVPVFCVWLVVAVAKNSSPVVATVGTAAPDGGSRILGFDGLRAIAVGLVVCSHAGLIEGGAWERSGAARIFNAQVGVQIFFVLSGLLITHLMLVEQARTGRVNLSRFYLRRVLRIFPVYYAAIAVSLALTAAGIYIIHPLAFGAAITYIVNFASWDYMEATFSHFWSLAVEEHFYFFWPLAMVLARGRARLVSLLAAAAIIVMTLWLAYPPAIMVDLAHSHAVTRWTIPAALPILVGCLTACLLWNRTLPASLSYVSGIAGALTFMLPLVPFAHAQVPVAFHPLLSSAAIAAMMVFIIGRPHSAIVRFLEMRPLVYLGTLSYGIYVWQGILTGNGPYRQVPGWPPEPLVGAVLSVAVAALSYRFFEEPVLRYKDRLGRLTRPEN